MSKRVKFSLIFVASVLVISIWAFLTSVNLTTDFEGKLSNSEQANVEELVITETKNGSKYWEVYAKEGFYDSSKNGIQLSEVIGNFYKEGRVIMSFKASKGSYDSKNKEITLNNDATVVSENDVSINADKLVWKGTSEQIIATGNVKINNADEIITYSDKSVFNSDFTNLKLFGNTKTKIFRKG